MSYISDLADEIRGEVPEHLLPAQNADLLFLLYALVLLVKGERVGPEDVHNAWAVWMTHAGESHESLVPFRELSKATKEEDEPFVRAIKTVAVRRAAHLPDAL
jgi:hypothetical protein